MEQQLREFAAKHPTVRAILADDDDYPSALRGLPGCPALLFIDGEFAPGDRNSIAVVGSRTTSADGVHAAQLIGTELARRGYTVVSGLARGVDAAAHEGALAAGSRTIAVIGTGIDRVFPSEHAELDGRIRRSGLVVSQFRPGAAPTKTSFPSRNALIAGLARGTVVVDARERSGTRITIDRTLEQGKPVMFWAPTMASRSWVNRLAAAEPQVHLVGSVGDVVDVIERSHVR